MKGYTNIPYAKQMAALMQGPEAFGLNFEDKDFWFWMRVMHFESRYWSIDQLLKYTDSKNILELSSGYSLRGLDMAVKSDVHYIDTDLPEVIATKQQIIDQLRLGKELKGKFDLLPLNALDVPAFHRIVNQFESGPLTVVNEGLLMYLDMEEKKKLCDIIHSSLKERGGCWITADIYVKRPPEMMMTLPQSEKEAAFFEQHKIEENKFDNYEAAEAFFNQQGFKLVREAVPDYVNMSALPYLKEAMPASMRDMQGPPPKIQATWMLATI